MRIIKRGNEELPLFEMEEFQSVEKGEKEFIFEPFPHEELTIQDVIEEGKKNEFHEKPKEPQKTIIQKEAHIDASEPSTFRLEEFFGNELVSDNNQTDRIDSMVEEISALRKQISDISAINADLKTENETLKAQIDSEIAIAREQSYKEGYDKASIDLAERDRKTYEAQQIDYIAKIDSCLLEVQKEVLKIQETLNTVDTHMPDIVLSYVKHLIGEERILNDRFIINVVDSAMDKLKDLQNVVLTVNPEDAQVLSEKYPNFGVNIDPSMPKGNIRVKTKVGEFDLSVDAWLKELENKIDEQFKNTKIH